MLTSFRFGSLTPLTIPVNPFSGKICKPAGPGEKESAPARQAHRARAMLRGKKEISIKERSLMSRVYQAASLRPSSRQASRASSLGDSLAVRPSSSYRLAPAAAQRLHHSRIHWPSPQP